VTDARDPFREYHRSRRWMTLTRALAAAGVSAAVAVGLVLMAAAAPPPQAPAVAESTGIPTPAQSAAPEQTSTLAPAPAVALPAPAPAPVAAQAQEPPPTELPATGPASWTIAIDTRGYQAEIDQCLWVRMDLGGQAPIVGAHNYCGGGVVLEMRLGDVVTLTGTGLDGTYLVTDSRDARAGDTAATAIKGMLARVVLQTCYWEGDGSERLVGLTPAPIA
jgi:hypothetical protein